MRQRSNSGRKSWLASMRRRHCPSRAASCPIALTRALARPWPQERPRPQSRDRRSAGSHRTKALMPLPQARAAGEAVSEATTGQELGESSLRHR